MPTPTKYATRKSTPQARQATRARRLQDRLNLVQRQPRDLADLARELGVPVR